MRIQLKKILICAAILVFCGVILSYGISFQPVTDNRTSNRSPANEEIINLYKELIALRQYSVAENKRLIAIGQGNIEELLDCEMNASEARIQLARFIDRNEIVIDELQKLVQVIEGLTKSVKMEIEAGTRPKSWLYNIDARLLETKIRLAKAKQE